LSAGLVVLVKILIQARPGIIGRTHFAVDHLHLVKGGLWTRIEPQTRVRDERTLREQQGGNGPQGERLEQAVFHGADIKLGIMPAQSNRTAGLI
jgi:hypothetical protein